MSKGLLAILIVAGLAAQSVKLPVRVDELSRLAIETVDVTMDGSMIRFAERFLSDRDPEQAKAKRILRGLNAIYVKQFEFAKAGSYSQSDLDGVRAQLRTPDWSRMVQVKGQGENVEVYAKMQAGEMNGLFVLAAEPKELTLVHIDGPVRPEDLATLSGHAGLPKFNLQGASR